MKLLFICTHNRCRSILAEAIANQEGSPWIEARSAGSQPSGKVHPLTLRYLQDQGFATRDLRSKSWDELQDFDPDFVITVCDSAAKESCPLWLGQARRIHWGLQDPSKLAEHDAAAAAAAFRHTITLLQNRIHRLLAFIQQQEGGHDPAAVEAELKSLAQSTPG